MNACAFTGRIYNLKDNGKSGRDANVRFSLGVRKAFLTDKDKKDGKILNFVPCNLWGERAEWLVKYFKEGDYISIIAEWDPFEGDKGETVPQFRVIKADFPAGVSSENNSNGDRSDRRQRRSRDDEDDDRGSRRESRRARKDEEPEDEVPRRRRRAIIDDEDEDDGVPF